MAKICIMCEQRAGAGEHTFPASMGGRRTNRGIYCSHHEKLLGPLIVNLSEQLKMFQSLLCIRHDRKDAPEPFEHVMPNGEKVIAFDGIIKRADPNLAYKTDTINIPSTFGGPEGLRVVAYIALNLFAQHFQPDVRKQGLEGIKRYLRGEVENDFVWWEREETAQQLPPNPFAFGHTIALSTCARTGAAQAVVSLFQSLDFGVDLGTVEEARDRSVAVFLDPQAERAPDDLEFVAYDDVIFQLQKPQPLHQYLEEMIKNGASQSGFQIFMNRVQRWKFNKDMSPEIEALNLSRQTAGPERFEAVKTFVERQTNRIYKLMQKTTQRYDETQDLKIADNRIMSTIFHKMIELDTSDPGNLTAYAHEVAQSAMHNFVEAIRMHLDQADVDYEFMWELFNAGRGFELVGNAMREPAIDMFVAVQARRAGYSR